MNFSNNNRSPVSSFNTNETIKHVNEHDVKELVRNEIYDIEEKRRMMK